MAIVMVFDTETTDVGEKPFCYNVGWVITDTDSHLSFIKRDFVVEQIWHNLPLFSTAYYAEKRNLYIQAMRSRKAILDKWGYVLRQMARDIKEYKVEYAYAYNSPFDDRVFQFNCDWFKTINPLENIPVLDIRGMVSEFIINTEEYKDFCETNLRFTESGNYSATAETVYQYITAQPDFSEAHTALADSEIETEILLECLGLGTEIGKEYKVIRQLPRYQEMPFAIKVDGETIYKGTYKKKYVRNGLYCFKTKI